MALKVSQFSGIHSDLPPLHASILPATQRLYPLVIFYMHMYLLPEAVVPQTYLASTGPELAGHNEWGLTWTSGLCWVRMVRMGIFALFLILVRKHWVLHCRVWCQQQAFSFVLFVECKSFPSVPNLLSWMVRMLFVRMLFQLIICFFLFSLWKWWITLIEFWITNQVLMPGIHCTWSWHGILLLGCWIQFVNIPLRIFTSKFVRDISV